MLKVRVLALGLGILLLLALVMIGCAAGQANEAGSPLSTRVTVQPGDTVEEISGLLVPCSLNDLVLHSDTIIIGTVTDILPAKRGVLAGGLSIIYTDVIIQADRYLYGEPESERIAIQVWGGRIGNIVMLSFDEAEFTLGEHIVVFLFRPPYEIVSPDGIDALSYYRVSCACQGKFAYRCGIAYRFPFKLVTTCAIEIKVAEIKGR